MKNKLENKQYYFLELLEKIGIKIPIIQRDYAQGRDNDKTKSIRENFLKNLFDVISKNKSLNLDFVYGTIKDNYLIPLDGQQRLTTLFLIHYYLALKEERLDDNLKNKLKKFTYETRISSREFCRLLVEKEIILNDENISQTIKNQTWFFSEWENDPTIKSMLIMLDSIENIFKNYKNCFDNLNKITFSFLDLEKFKLTDELYIKMNARGKPLSDFENFKSKFENHIDNSNLNDKEQIKAKLDNEWLDIFWNLEKENLKNANEEKRKEILKSIDDKYFNFFKNITAFFSKDFNEINVFKYNYTKSDIDKIIKTLDCLVKYKDYQEIINEIRDNINIFEDFIISNKDRNFTYEKRAKFYALMLFFIYKNNLENNKNLFKSWMRVSLNIIHNTIFDKNDDFISILNLLNNLVTFLEKDFYCKLSTSNISKSDQFEEEQIKAKLILSNPRWEEEFIKAEKHWYLDGEVRFLIEYSEKTIGKFIIYRDKFKKLWDFTKTNENKSIKNNEMLLQRALLTFGEYIKYTKHNQKYTFCTFGTGLREKNENWRKVFGQIIFKDFLDFIKTIDNLTIKLNKIINSYDFNCNDWKSYFINPNKNWAILDETKNYQIYKDNELINLNRGSTKVTSWGWSKVYNLYNYYLYRYLKYDLKVLENKLSLFKKIEPLASTEYPCFYIDEYKIDNFYFAIDVFYHNHKFLMRFFDRNKNKFSQNLIDYLENNNFKLNVYKHIREYGYWNDEFDLCHQDDLIEFLENFVINIKKELKNDPI